jgi:hypothetical protein
MLDLTQNTDYQKPEGVYETMKKNGYPDAAIVEFMRYNDARYG